MAAAWVLIFGAMFIGFTLKDDFIDLGRRIVADTKGEPIVGDDQSVRLRRDPDGHFWATVQLNGEPVRFLIDSGATITSISAETAQRSGIESGAGFPARVSTANGEISVQRARVERLTLGPIEREDMAVHVFPRGDDLNVLGMNFLSSLSSWGVEGRFLVLKP
jgi:aspartyl protease family protein